MYFTDNMKHLGNLVLSQQTEVISVGTIIQTWVWFVRSIIDFGLFFIRFVDNMKILKITRRDLLRETESDLRQQWAETSVTCVSSAVGPELRPAAASSDSSGMTDAGSWQPKVTNILMLNKKKKTTTHENVKWLKEKNTVGNIHLQRRHTWVTNPVPHCPLEGEVSQQGRREVEEEK